MTDGFVLQQHRPFNAVNATCYLSGSRYELSNFNFICAQQFLLEVSLRMPSTFSMRTLPTHLLSTFTMPPARVGLQSLTTGTFDPSNFATILDHDTNVFCEFFFSYIMLDNVHIPCSHEQSLRIGSSSSY